MANNFINRFIKQPPVMFPLVALFHMLMLAFSIYNASSEPLSSLIWLQPLWMVAYTIAWVFVCGMKKWAALAYILLTALNVLLYFVASDLYVSSLFLMDVVFSMILMAYYKHFKWREL
jgi:hypothetical protein